MSVHPSIVQSVDWLIGKAVGRNVGQSVRRPAIQPVSQSVHPHRKYINKSKSQAVPTWILTLGPPLANVHFGTRNTYSIYVYAVTDRTKTLCRFKVSICFTAWYKSSWCCIGWVISSLPLTLCKCWWMNKTIVRELTNPFDTTACKTVSVSCYDWGIQVTQVIKKSFKNLFDLRDRNRSVCLGLKY